ncbi:MAG: lipoyl(octanoyl) transferase LipB [Pseudomonadota bacterium]|jgi:lipoyl(octanoyl) transferase
MNAPLIRELGLTDYTPVWRAMQAFTSERDGNTPDQLWVLQHNSVFTQGQAGKPEHILDAHGIPVVQSDRGGQVTYHGPGQLVIYFLLDVRRRGFGVRALVDLIECSLLSVLASYGVEGHLRKGAPGVYVEDRKIAALGLRVRKGGSLHGLSFNVDMDLAPFGYINPCGYAGMGVTQLRALVPPHADLFGDARKRLVGDLLERLL